MDYSRVNDRDPMGAKDSRRERKKRRKIEQFQLSYKIHSHRGMAK